MAQQGTAAAAAAAAASNGAAPAPASSSYYNYEDPADQLLPDQSTNLGAAGDEDDDEDYDSEDDEHAAAAGGQQTYGDFVAQGGMKQQQEGSDVEGGDGEDEEARLAEAEERKRELEEDVPEEVKRFIVSFHQAILANDSSKILYMYESGWNKLTQQYFAADEWPEAEVIAPLVGGDHVFMTLYRELFYRHVYARLEPNVDDRFNSYENVCELFSLLLNSESPVPLELPIQWLWDMLDEFVYQFQSFAQWRANPSNKSEDELALLGAHSQTWSCYSVLNVLYSLVQKSRINEQLAAEREGASAEEVAEIAGEYGSRPLYRNLGYFSLICLLRVHVLIGDPTLALQTMENVQLSTNAPLTKITACHVATYYHVGFAYLALGRYPDAIRTFVSVLIYFNRMKQYHTRSYQYNSINRTCERMYALLAIATTLSPGPTDEGIMSFVKERHGDALASLQRGGEQALPVYRELFTGACPKFLSQIAPPYEDADALAMWVAQPPADPLARQVDLFASQVAPLLAVPAMRSFLKLYTSIDAGKVASFLENESEDDVLERLMLVKAASRTYGHVTAESSNLLHGTRVVTNNLDFYVDGSMVQVAETTTNRRYAGFFIRNAENAQKVFDTIRHAPLPITRAAQQQSTQQQQQTNAQQSRGGAGATGGRGGSTAGGRGGAASSRGGSAWATAGRGGSTAKSSAWASVKA